MVRFTSKYLFSPLLSTVVLVIITDVLIIVATLEHNSVIVLTNKKKYYFTIQERERERWMDDGMTRLWQTIKKTVLLFRLIYKIMKRGKHTHLHLKTKQCTKKTYLVKCDILFPLQKKVLIFC